MSWPSWCSPHGVEADSCLHLSVAHRAILRPYSSNQKEEFNLKSCSQPALCQPIGSWFALPKRSSGTSASRSWVNSLTSLVGLRVRMRTDKDDAAWRKLKRQESITALKIESLGMNGFPRARQEAIDRRNSPGAEHAMQTSPSPSPGAGHVCRLDPISPLLRPGYRTSSVMRASSSIRVGRFPTAERPMSFFTST